ncbi:MAG: hypothetical protein LBQ68_05830 [Clostridiales bacterium]|nr:hypothetical protein [Clostridiales bacterium]
MTETVMTINSLQEFLMKTLNTDKIKVRGNNRVFTIEPVGENEYKCPLYGAAVGSKLTVDKFLEMTREENESW